MDLLSSEVAGFAGIETHTYPAGEPMRPLERLKRLHLWIVRGGLSIQVETAPGIRSIIEVFGPCSSLDPRQLCLRDPLRRVSGALLQLAERLGSSTPSARGSRLELTQHLIAAFADLSRQTTNRQLRRLAAVQLVDLKRGLVSVWDVAALAEVATGRRQL